MAENISEENECRIWSFLYNSNMVIPRKKVEKKIPQSKIRLLTSQVSKNLIEQRGI